MKNKELLNNIFLTYNHSEGTQRIYIYALEKYSSYFGMSLQELLNEAESEESAGIKWKHRKIKMKLLEFRQYLLNNLALNTVKSIMITVIKFYKFYDIEVHELPKINEKSIQKPQPIYYSILLKVLSIFCFYIFCMNLYFFMMFGNSFQTLSWKNDKLYRVNIILCSFSLKKYGFEHFDSIALGAYFF